MNTQNLKTLQNQALHLHMQGLYKSERELLHQVLITLQEIYFRKMYLEFHFDSLFNYLTEGTGYTKGTAHRRIQAMLLLNEVPSVGEKIKSGEINFARMNIVQKTAKDLAYRTTKKVTAKEKEQLLDLLANKEVAESQQTVAEFFDMPVRQKVEVCWQADGSLRVTLTISTELREKIEKVQGLISHALPEKDLLKYLEYLTEKTLRQKTAVRSFKARKIEEIKPASEVKAKNANRVGSQSQFHMELKPFTARQRKLVLAAQKCCQQNDAKSGKACVSNWQLQVDHIIPLWAGGQSTLENAQVLCGVHNRRKYQTQAGVR